MVLLVIQISQQFAKIGLEINNASYELDHKKPDLKIIQSPADFNMQINESELSVDYTQMRESMGVGGIGFISRSFTSAVQQEYLEKLEKYIQLGKTMGAIEKNVSIGEIVFNSTQPQESQIEIVSLAPIAISYTPSTIESRVEVGGVQGELDYGKISVENYIFASVKVFLEQEPYIDFEAVGQVIDLAK